MKRILLAFHQGDHVKQGMVFLLLGMASLIQTGCGGADPRQSLTAQRMRRVAAIYFDYVAARGVAPQTRDELLNHARQLPMFLVPETDDAELEELLVSDRDGEALVIEFGQAITGISSRSPLPIIAEQEGENGYRLVAYLNGAVDLVRDGETRVGGLRE